MKKTPNLKGLAFCRTAYLQTRREAKRSADRARNEWAEQCLTELKKVKTAEDAKALFKLAPWGTEAKIEALKRWVALCRSEGSLDDIWRATRRHFHHDHPVWVLREKRLQARLKRAVSRDALVGICRKGVAADFFWDAEENSLAKYVALSRLLAACSSPADVWDLQHDLVLVQGCVDGAVRRMLQARRDELARNVA